MSVWVDHTVEAKVIAVLTDVPLAAPGHHFGRPYMTAYQLAIECIEGTRRSQPPWGSLWVGRESANTTPWPSTWRGNCRDGSTTIQAFRSKERSSATRTCIASCSTARRDHWRPVSRLAGWTCQCSASLLRPAEAARRRPPPPLRRASCHLGREREASAYPGSSPSI
jgi:hypothetical protein